MFLKFELQRALSKSPIGMRCCCTEVLQCCARADHYGLYIAFYIMKFFRRNIDFRGDDDGTSDPSVIEGEFCTCFLKNDQDHLLKKTFCNYLLPNIFTIIYGNIWKIIGSDPNR